MSQGGYIPLHREYFESWPFKEPRVFSNWEAWLDLCRMAAFKPHNQMIDGKLFKLGYGQLVASNRYLMQAWGWRSKTKVQTFLKNLKETEEIEVEKVHNTSLITCCKLACYYTLKVNQRSIKSHLEVNQRSIKGQIKEGKEYKKEKKVTTTTKKEVVEVDETKINWFSQLKSDELFIEQTKRQYRINDEKYQNLLKEFYRQKKALGELNHQRYTELRKNFLFWIPKNMNGKKRNGYSKFNEGQGVQYPGSTKLKLPTN